MTFIRLTLLGDCRLRLRLSRGGDIRRLSFLAFATFGKDYVISVRNKKKPRKGSKGTNSWQEEVRYFAPVSRNGADHLCQLTFESQEDLQPERQPGKIG